MKALYDDELGFAPRSREQQPKNGPEADGGDDKTGDEFARQGTYDFVSCVFPCTLWLLKKWKR
jgi:hypothetical protein